MGKSFLTTLVVSVKRKAKEKFVCETIVNTLSEAMNNSLLKNDNNCVFRELIIVILEHFPKLNMIEKLNLDFGSDFIPSLGTACCLMTMANNESLSSKHFANKVLIPCLKMYCQKLKDPSGLSVDQMQDCYNCFSKMLRFDLHKVMAYIVKRKTDFGLILGLSIMSELIKFSYTEKHEHLTTIYEMINGHSNFLKLLLSMQAGEDVFSLMKKDLLLLINSIVSISPELVSQEHIPLSMRKKHSFASFQPIVWGSLAISRYTIGTSEKKNLWKVPRCSEILGLIDADKMYETAINFPIEMTLFNENTFYENDPSKYDPRFYLQLFSSLCSSERYIDKHLKLQEYGALALALASISSKDEDMRALVNASESDDTPRKWILEVIEDGLKDYLDYYILLKVRIIRVLLSFNGSILSTNEEEIFNIIEKCLRLKDGALDLIQSQGFLIWCLSKRSSQKKTTLRRLYRFDFV
ncbi:unnamed protein product [Lepeophtheirus salmonis]|uniref:(salmon louse) hypothetical protein n=1 Tax=Lepeophtheirus salmonis TaxID=72036 RepID=A0A7R8H810_LEPSM|nr:unnamed protein product [Lepeophtheirus salmonis]CAF2932214.1 unnamed protein product [Lepeophtheirus salmonis]